VSVGSVVAVSAASVAVGFAGSVVGDEPIVGCTTAAGAVVGVTADGAPHAVKIMPNPIAALNPKVLNDFACFIISPFT